MVTLLVYRISGGLATLSGLAIGEVATAPTLRISKQTMPHAANHIPPATVAVGVNTLSPPQRVSCWQ